MEKTISEQVREFRDEITMLQGLNDDYRHIRKHPLSVVEHEGRRLRLNQIKKKLTAFKGVTRFNDSGRTGRIDSQQGETIWRALL
jgi:hypothetical protein